MTAALFKGNVPRYPRTTAPSLRDMLVPCEFATLEEAKERARDEAIARGQWMYVYSLLLPRPEDTQKVFRTLRRRYYVYPGGPAFHVDMWHHASLSPHTTEDTTAEEYVPAQSRAVVARTRAGQAPATVRRTRYGPLDDWPER
jgi:hypothetical protein